jgi:hypothetical protein
MRLLANEHRKLDDTFLLSECTGSLWNHGIQGAGLVDGPRAVCGCYRLANVDECDLPNRQNDAQTIAYSLDTYSPQSSS